MENKKEFKFICKLCGKIYNNGKALNGHTTLRHRNIIITGNKKEKLELICKQCKKLFLVIPSDFTRLFCSVRCSNKSRKKIQYLKVKSITKLINNNTKNELFEKRKNWQSARSSIREYATRVYFEDNKLECRCKICGYTTHVEICHIKSVSSFSGESIISEINAIENLVALCPNHHWEFDNGILKL